MIRHTMHFLLQDAVDNGDLPGRRGPRKTGSYNHSKNRKSHVALLMSIPTEIDKIKETRI